MQHSNADSNDMPTAMTSRHRTTIEPAETAPTREKATTKVAVSFQCTAVFALTPTLFFLMYDWKQTFQQFSGIETGQAI